MTSPRLRPDDVFTTEVDGQTVILDGRTSTYLVTNAVGSHIVALLQTSTSLDEVAHHVARTFDVDVDTAGKDCREFLDELARNGLLEE